jgi:hypothetical protein
LSSPNSQGRTPALDNPKEFKNWLFVEIAMAKKTAQT